ncbi:MAG: tetratricopeptide repeat protein [Psychrobium sp.]|nr:tetratricopeptide repeat protein [Psychrobium sp.]
MHLIDNLPDIHAMTAFEILLFSSEATSEELDIEKCKALLIELTNQVIAISEQEQSLEQRWLAFNELFYGHWHFAIDESDYFSIKSNNLYHFIEHRIGNNALSTILVEHLLNLLELQPQIIDFPGPFVIKLNGLSGQYIDPLNGKALSNHLMESLVRGHLGDHIRLQDEHLMAAGEVTVKKRFLASLKQACLLDEDYELGLMFSELILELVPDDPNQIMERGFILQQLDYYCGAAIDFAFFIEHCPEHPNSEVLKGHIDKLKTQSVVMH